MKILTLFFENISAVFFEFYLIVVDLRKLATLFSFLTLCSLIGFAWTFYGIFLRLGATFFILEFLCLMFAKPKNK